MPWFRLDDKSWSHPKVVAAGNAAWGAFCRLGAYASDHLTDGIIPSTIAQLIAPVESLDKLVEVGLLDRGDDGAFLLHDFLDWNPSAGDVEAKRSKLSELRSKAGREGGIRSGEKRRKNKDFEAKGSKLLRSNEATSKQTRTPVPIPGPIPSSSTLSQDYKHSVGNDAKQARSRAPSKVERPEAIVWKLFRSAYERHRRTKYVSDAARDGKAAKQIAEAATEVFSSSDALRIRCVAYWCDAYFEIEDPWLEAHGYPMTALVRALPRLGTPPNDFAPPDETPAAPPADAATRQRALDAIAEAQRQATPFLFDDVSKTVERPNGKPSPSADVARSVAIGTSDDADHVPTEIGTSESQQHGGATR